MWAKEAPFASWREIVPRLACPVLLITAEPALGGIVTPELAAEAARLKVAHIAGVGHNIRREQFEPYVAAVMAFLASVY